MLSSQPLDTAPTAKIPESIKRIIPRIIFVHSLLMFSSLDFFDKTFNT